MVAKVMEGGGGICGKQDGEDASGVGQGRSKIPYWINAVSVAE